MLNVAEMMVSADCAEILKLFESQSLKSQLVLRNRFSLLKKLTKKLTEISNFLS